jgi:hypothetical protein
VVGGVKLNNKNHAHFRIEAIDSLETHYKKEHQPVPIAKSATDYLFELLAIRNVIWNSTGSKVKETEDGVSGFVVARYINWRFAA